MDMGRDAAGEVVELVYQPTAKDFAGALRVRRGVSRGGRAHVWLMGVAVFGAVMLVAGALSEGGTMTVPLAVGVSVSVLLMALQPRFQAWFVARRLYGYVKRHGTYRVTVTDAGVSATTDNSTTSVNWTAQPRYLETADAFYTFSGDKNAVGFNVLPKRAVRDPADVDRLRTLLDRNLTRV